MGDGTTIERTTPVQVVGPGGAGYLTGVTAIAGGGYFSLALKDDGTVWAWGDNGSGQLGNAVSAGACGLTDCTSLTPVEVNGLSGVVAIAGGGGHTLALKDDGTVWTLGDNSYGQLGAASSGTCINNDPCSTTPLQAGGMAGVTAIVGGGTHSVALQNDGTVWDWGSNQYGQLGAVTSGICATVACSTTPLQVGSLGGVAGISAGRDHSLALQSDGTVWAWGGNYDGQLGDGTQTNRGNPVQVIGSGGSGYLTGITIIKGGSIHSLALKSDGTVWAWGDNHYGELGHSSPLLESTSPLQVIAPSGSGYLTGMTTIAAGGGYSVAAGTLPTQAAPSGTQYNDAPYGGTGGMRVQTYTGAFAYTYSHADVVIAGRGPSPAFVRSYSSNDTRAGPLGIGWTYNYATHLADPGDGTGDVILVGPQGRSDRYTVGSGGAYAAPPAVYTALVKNEDGSFTATQQDLTTWLFDGAGHLLRIRDRFGNQSNLSYNGSGQLSSVSDPAGRGSLTFGYNTSGQLVSVVDWLSPARTVQLSYDGSGRLATVTDRANNVTTYGYDGNGRLVTITDANMHVIVTNTYDSSGRVATQKDALGVTTGQQTTYAYSTSNKGVVTTTIT